MGISPKGNGDKSVIFIKTGNGDKSVIFIKTVS